jgi:methionyl aminopeptidase
MPIPIKNAEAIAAMREAGAIAATVLYQLKELVRPGITTYDLDQAGRDFIAGLGATSACHGYQPGGHSAYPAHTCISVNDEVVHGIGSLRRVLQDGDIVSLDVVISHRGYIGDNALTVPVGPVHPAKARLLAVTEEALRLGIAQAQVGNRIGDISATIQAHVEKNGCSVVRDMVGHGVGRSMHEEPQIPNFGKRGRGDLIQPGMTLAIEPMVNLGSHRTKVLRDGWTIVTVDGSSSAHFEHTVLTTAAGPEILTLPRLPVGDVHALRPRAA